MERFSLARIMEANARILKGDAEAILQSGVFYSVQSVADESIGGNAGPRHYAIVTYVNPRSGQILAVGIPQYLPPEVLTGTASVAFQVECGPHVDVITKVNVGHGVIDTAVRRALVALKDKGFQPLDPFYANVRLDSTPAFDPRRLRVISPGPGQTKIAIGRSETVDYRVTDPRTSRVHATLQQDPHGNWWIYDGSIEVPQRKSKNGVILARGEMRRRLANPVALRDGDMIVIPKRKGNFQFVFKTL